MLFFRDPSLSKSMQQRQVATRIKRQEGLTGRQQNVSAGMRSLIDDPSTKFWRSAREQRQVNVRQNPRFLQQEAEIARERRRNPNENLFRAAAGLKGTLGELAARRQFDVGLGAGNWKRAEARDFSRWKEGQKEARVDARLAARRAETEAEIDERLANRTYMPSPGYASRSGSSTFSSPFTDIRGGSSSTASTSRQSVASKPRIIKRGSSYSNV